MANTINTPVNTTWTLVGGPGLITASAMHPSYRAEWIVSDSGTPAETLIGHPVPRNATISLTLVSERLYMRNLSGNHIVAAVTVGVA